jgi:serine/threonine protein kinase
MVLAERYRLEAEIGQGGFSQVFRATELRMGREVAVKILGRDSVDAAGAARFAREAELARQLAHPNTVRLLDYELDHRPSPFIVYELLSGETLEQVLKRAGPFSEQRAVKITTALLKKTRPRPLAAPAPGAACPVSAGSRGLLLVAITLSVLALIALVAVAWVALGRWDRPGSVQPDVAPAPATT